MTIRRVLLINYEYPPVGGGGGNASYHIARAMAARGLEPFVLTAAQGDLPRSEFTDGVTVRRIPAFRSRAYRCSVPEMVAYIASACVNGPGVMRAWRPDVSLAFHALPSGAVNWFLRQTHNLPYAIALQGHDVPGFEPETMAGWHRMTRGLLRRLWAGAGAVVANSDGLAALARRFAPEIPIGMIPAGADLSGIAAKATYQAAAPLKILFVGRLVRQKGLDVLIAALALLPKHLAWTLVLVGDGPERAALTALAARHEISARVQIRGWVDKAAMPAVYADADLFVLPSRDEGMPNALLEAMSAGLPVIGTRIRGTADVVTSGETGLLVGAEDAEALSRALASLIENPTARETLGRAGRAHVEAHHGWTSVADAWIDVLTRVRKEDARR
jgi:glycosyltransferase involved in cell wall biosynthesis